MKIDSIASGLSFMLMANVAQRGIGFVRNLGFCFFLCEQHLGLWALASAFFLLAAPFSVLGLPGSLGRFVEYYRVRGQLGIYVRRIAIGSLMGSFVVCAGLVLFAPPVSNLILGRYCGYATMAVLSGTLFTVIVFNFLNELVSGLRQPGIASSMQMVNSMSFTAFGLLWLTVSNDWRGLMVAFALASMLGMIPAWYGLRTRCAEAFEIREPLDRRAMWQRIVPFAAAIWSMNLLTNLFDVVDRYMILHCASDSVEAGQAIVGQYHSGRILPVLLTSLGLMINGMLLPYLSADWEAGRMAQVRKILRSSYVFVALFFWGLSLAGMIAAPLLFENLLRGRYAEGLSLMPMAMVHCSLATLAMLLQNYFWCAERGRIVGFVTALGLALNLVLNYSLVPTYGAWGAMLATMISGGMILLLTVLRLQQEGVKVGKRNLLVSMLPLTLIASTWLSVFCFAVVLFLIYKTNWILSESDRKLVAEHSRPLRRKFGLA